MRERAGIRRSLDVEDLASRRAVLAGVVEPDAMPRLLETAVAAPGAIRYRVVFTRDAASGRPKLSGRVEGMLPLVCQRCLGRLEWSFDTRFESVVVEDEREDTGELDAVICSGGRIALGPVIEEEILLALPSAPVHPRGTCSAPSFRTSREPPPARRSNPFSALDALRSDHGRERSG